MAAHHTDTLQEIYDLLPAVTCAHCGSCCSLWAGMRYVEYGNVRQYIDNHWTGLEIEALEQRIRRHYRIRSVYLDAPRTMPRLLPSTHCLLYDEAAERCKVYPARPLDCRLYGFNRECDRLVLQNDEAVHAATRFTASDYASVVDRMSSFNKPYTDSKTGRTIRNSEAKPIEFWFALFAVGWDPTLDQNDPQFLASRENQPESLISPTDS
jgi:Fe-S-cluster containining protein